MAKRRKKSTRRAAKRPKTGAGRSGLENVIIKAMRESKLKHEYETLKLPYTIPASKRAYLPDIILPNGIIIEIKGRFTATDRKKMKLVKEENPDLDIRIIFDHNNLLRKEGKMRYGRWAELNGFPHYCFVTPGIVGEQDEHWLDIVKRWYEE